MKKFSSIGLLEQLQSDVRQMIATAMILQSGDPGKLLQQPAPGKWSVVQVLEHLNSYGRYYLPVIEGNLRQETPANAIFKPGWLGDYFTKLMLPSADGTVTKKMTSPNDHRPPANLDIFPVLNTFIEQQHLLLELLEKAKTRNIGLIRIPVSISRFVRLKLGDTFRFLVAHEQRHFVQVANVMSTVEKVTSAVVE